MGVELSLTLLPGRPWIPYLSLVPGTILICIPMVMRYWQTRDCCVFLKQVASSVWIVSSVVMTWFLVTDIDLVNDGYMRIEGYGIFAAIWSLAMLLLVFSTLAFPV